MMTLLCYNTGIKEVVMDKVCTKCQQRLAITEFSKDKYKRGGYRSACKACSAQEFAEYKASPAYKDRLKRANEARLRSKTDNPVAHWAHVAFHNAKKRAALNGIEHTITKDWLAANAPTNCPLLGVSLVYDAVKCTATSASLDRKNPSLGYTPDNCWVISFKANRIKTDASLQELKVLVKNMARYYNV